MLHAAGAFVAFVLLMPAGVAAQNSTTTTKAKCVSGVAPWSFNSEGDSPCDIAMSLAGVCIDTTFTLAPLEDGFVYLGPDVLNANACRCSSVYYSLLSACADCQNRNWITWDRYKSNCTTVYSQVFAKPLPLGVGVPNYAYLNVETTGTFDAVAAAAASGPESTRLPSPTGSSTATSGGKKSNTGAIAGGVVGGVVGLLLIGGLVFWLLRRRRANKVPASSYDPNLLVGPAQNTFQTEPKAPEPVSTPDTSYPTTHVTGSSFGNNKVYDPNDPSTFPTAHTGHAYNPYDTGANMSNGQTAYQPQMAQYNNGAPAFQQTHAPARPHYTGAPEV